MARVLSQVLIGPRRRHAKVIVAALAVMLLALTNSAAAGASSSRSASRRPATGEAVKHRVARDGTLRNRVDASTKKLRSRGSSTKPVVTGVGPSFGPSTGGTAVVIVGKNFTSVTAVDFGTTPAVSFSVTTENSINATSPPGTGLVNVLVSTSSGTSNVTAADKFDYGPSIQCQPGIACAPVSPPYGSYQGGTIVTISGENFTGVTAVNFGFTSLTSSATNPPPSPGEYYFAAASEIIVNTPPGTGTVPVTVVTPGGTSPSTSGDQFDYGPTLSCPTGQVASCPVSPAFGPPAGGTQVTITGTNFTTVTGVNFGTTVLSATATNPPPSPGQYNIVSDTEIVADSPPGVGTVNVVVSSPGGTSAEVSSDEFGYGPIVTALSPNSGPATGGTTVTITGGNFTGAFAVYFGNVAAKSFSVVSDTSITAVSPPSKLSSVEIAITTPGGTNPPNAAATYGFGPVVARIKPAYGIGTGGTTVTIMGLNFNKKTVTGIDFGGTPASFFRFKSSTKIITTSPPGTGSVDVTVQSSAGVSPPVPADKFDYAPSVSSVNPRSGKRTGGTNVTVVGTNFAGVSQVNFGTNPATKFTIESSKKISAVSPAGSGTVDVTVIGPGGTSPLSSSDQFTY